MKKIYYLTILIGMGLYVFWLSLTGKINYYIHPRYNEFTYAFAIFAIIIATIGLIRVWEQRRNHKIKFDLRRGEILASFSMILVLLLGLGLPVKALSSATASQREIDFNSLNLKERPASQLFFQDTKSLNMGDWVVSLNNNPEPANYINKEVRVSGFAYIADNLPDNTFRLARFVITCCAVDARPVGLLVELGDQEIQDNQWYQITGKFQLHPDNNSLVIVPETVTEISEPSEPYIY